MVSVVALSSAWMAVSSVPPVSVKEASCCSSETASSGISEPTSSPSGVSPFSSSVSIGSSASLDSSTFPDSSSPPDSSTFPGSSSSPDSSTSQVFLLPSHLLKLSNPHHSQEQIFLRIITCRMGHQFPPHLYFPEILPNFHLTRLSLPLLYQASQFHSIHNIHPMYHMAIGALSKKYI